MNTMGKILVILNFLFALIVGGFLGWDLMTRKDWKGYAEGLERNLKVAKADTASWLGTYAKQQRELAKAHKNLLQKQLDYKALDERRKKEINDAKKEALNSDLSSSKHKLTRDALINENDLLTKQRDQLNNQIKNLEGLIVVLEQKNDKFLNLYQQAENDKETINQRNKALVERIYELEVKVAKGNTGAITGTTQVRNRNQPNPPLFYIKGIIQKVEGTEKNLVELSLGSDHGIKVGNTLNMFRTLPRAEYVGMVRITHVDPRTSVARVIRDGIYASQGNPRVGDEVASQIIPR